MATYYQRNELLKEMGFNSYDDYLTSELWRQIKLIGWKEHGTTCKLCKRKANVLHHRSYHREVLDGTDLSTLAPLCNRCHHDLEIDEKGEKRRLADVWNLYNKLAGISKVPPKKKPKRGKGKRGVQRRCSTCRNCCKKDLDQCARCIKGQRKCLDCPQILVLGKRVRCKACRKKKKAPFFRKVIPSEA